MAPHASQSLRAAAAQAIAPINPVSRQAVMMLMSLVPATTLVSATTLTGLRRVASSMWIQQLSKSWNRAPHRLPRCALANSSVAGYHSEQLRSRSSVPSLAPSHAAPTLVPRQSLLGVRLVSHDRLMLGFERPGASLATPRNRMSRVPSEVDWRDPRFLWSSTANYMDRTRCATMCCHSTAAPAALSSSHCACRPWR